MLCLPSSIYWVQSELCWLICKELGVNPSVQIWEGGGYYCGKVQVDGDGSCDLSGC